MCFHTILLDNIPWALSLWNNTIAVGSQHRDIIILDVVIGSQKVVLSGHIGGVRSLAFSSDGASLVSGSYDKTVKLWEVQTGGIVKAFHGHASRVCSVSISANHTTIASGSEDNTIHLWDIQTGECHQIIEQQNKVYCISFSPSNPQVLVSVSGNTVQQWDIDGHKVGPIYNGNQTAFSPDGSQLILCSMNGATVQDIDSGVVVAKFHMANSYFSVCCFSPCGRLVAIAAGYSICVWDITSSDPHLVETFTGHTNNITSLAFSSPSALISASEDRSLKFWQINAPSTNPVVTNPTSTPLTLTPTKTTALKAENGTIIPSNLDGVMNTWGISAGPCKESSQIPVEDSHQSNIQPIDRKLIFVCVRASLALSS